MPETHPFERTPRQPYPAQKARQGEIILKEPWQRAVFIAGLAGFFLLALVLAISRSA